MIIHIADAIDDDIDDDIERLVYKFKKDIDFNTLKDECNLIKPKIIANKSYLSLSDCDFNLMPVITDYPKKKIITDNPKKKIRSGGATKRMADTIKEVDTAGFILTRLKAAFKKNVEKDKDKEKNNNKYKAECFKSLISILNTYSDVDTKNYLHNNHFIFQQLQRGNLDEIIQNIKNKTDIDNELKEKAIVYINFLKNQKTEVASTTKEIINMIASYYDPINKKFQVQEDKQSLFDSLSKNNINKQHFLNLTAFIRQLCLSVNQMLLTKKGPFNFNDTKQTFRSSRLRSVVFNIYEILLTDSNIDIKNLLILLKKNIQEIYLWILTYLSLIHKIMDI